MTDKTIGRVENVFGWLKKTEHLDALFSTKHDALRDEMITKLEVLLEKDGI